MVAGIRVQTRWDVQAKYRAGMGIDGLYRVGDIAPGCALGAKAQHGLDDQGMLDGGWESSRRYPSRLAGQVGAVGIRAQLIRRTYRDQLDLIASPRCMRG